MVQLTGIIGKRRCIHKELVERKSENDQLNFELNQLQSLANIGVTTSMIAHEINNLLTPLVNYATLALNNPDDRQLAKKALRKTAQNSDRASKIMQSILNAVKGMNEDKKHTSLTELVEDAFSCLCRDFSKDAITVKIQIPQDLTVYVVAIQLQQVIVNLILNAREAMLSNGGVLTITAEQNEQTITVRVSDTGSGIETANLQRIFEPFFTTKSGENGSEQNGGYGLGLAFCRRVIEANNGSISVESIPQSGTSFEINLPRYEAEE